MEERTFFEQGDVKVTNARFVSGGQTYAMSNVTSVKPFEKKPPRALGIILALLGLGIMAGTSFMLGLLVLGAGLAILFLVKPVYHVLLATSAGETRALMTKNREYLNQVVQAVNEAMIHRG
ncbi:hypothetical protein CSQ94_20260 [Janthinobacterium sp. BJB312]|uniref:DUF6232 family protein n=1 Tax=Janthinobacterium sp. RA13 TaxID=1502762 RepID=UPI00055D9F98|nr:DUF6232 family protein [Janthinobacterium sp. RA13]PHV31621.1 hypothetical protein CSQ94_20260 [Janthinobacterium sp. BJB312]